MATRLTVVLNQSPVRVATTPDGSAMACDAVVGELLGRPGIDLVLINASALKDAQSTDALTMQSLTGDFAYLDWCDAPTGAALFENACIPGSRAIHDEDPQGDSNRDGGRRIYFFDMRRYKSAVDVLAVVRKLAGNRQVRTFTLGSMKPTSIAAPQSNAAEQEGFRDGRGKADTLETPGSGPLRDTASDHLVAATDQDARSKTSTFDPVSVQRRSSQDWHSPPTGPPPETPLDDLDVLVERLNQDDIF